MANAARARVEVKPALLRWARDRAGMQLDDLARRFPRLGRWKAERRARRAGSSSASPRPPMPPLTICYWRSRQSTQVRLSFGWRAFVRSIFPKPDLTKAMSSMIAGLLNNPIAALAMWLSN